LPDTAGHAQNPPETDISFRRDRVDAPPQHQSSAAAEYARRLTPPRRGRKIHNDAALQGRTTADWQPAAASEAGRISAEVRKYGRPELCSGSGYYGRPWRRVLRAALPVDLNRAAQLPATEIPRFPASRLPSSHQEGITGKVTDWCCEIATRATCGMITRPARVQML